MRNGNIFTMNTPNTEKLGDLLSQLGAILGVGRRSDGKFYLADMCTAESIKKWAKFKSIEHSTQVNLTDAQRKAANQGFDLKWWYDLDDMVSYVRTNDASWKYKEITSWKRLRDFDGYNHAMTMTPYKLIQSTSEEGIVQCPSTSNTITPMACNFTHKASAEIQPTDIGLFTNSYSYIYGVVACNQNWGNPTLYRLYKSMSNGMNQSGSDYHYVTMNPNTDIKWRYSLGSTGTENPAYFGMPFDESISQTMKFIPCIIRLSASTGGQAGYLPLPTERIMEYKTFNPTADVMVMWPRTTSPKPLRLYTLQSSGQTLFNSFTIRLSFLDLEKFDERGLDFEIGILAGYNGSTVRTKTITSSDFESYVVEKTAAGNDQYLYTIEVNIVFEGFGLPLYNNDFSLFTIDAYIGYDVKGGDQGQNKMYQNLAQEKSGPSSNFPLILVSQKQSPFNASVTSIMNLLTSTYYSIETLY